MIPVKLKPFKIIFFLFLISITHTSCDKDAINKVDISDIEVTTDVERFDELFYTTDPENLSNLKQKFPYLFPKSNPDSVWINKMQNKDEQALFEESQKLYADFTDESQKINSLFKHIKYYYPNFNEPKVITILTNVDYNSNVILADSLLFVSLDIFLGKDNQVYSEFPNYIKQNYTKEHLIVAVANKFSEQYISPLAFKSFVARMVQAGKKMALTQSFLPNIERVEIIGYTDDQYGWAENSEIEIWKYFMQNEMLYDTNPQLSSRFIEEAPFSKFFLEVDKDSPGRIGTWFGWQIVDSYLKNNDTSIQKVMLMDNEEIFKKSKYKPKK